MNQEIRKINRLLKDHKPELIRKFSIKKLGIFGSYVRGEQKQGSDIDILVSYKKLPDLLELIAMERYLHDLLGKKVDLVEKGGVRPEFKKYILNEVIYI